VARAHFISRGARTVPGRTIKASSGGSFRRAWAALQESVDPRHHETSWRTPRRESRHQPTIAAALDALDTTANLFAETGALRASGPPRGRGV